MAVPSTFEVILGTAVLIIFIIIVYSQFKKQTMTETVEEMRDSFVGIISLFSGGKKQ